MLAPGRMPARDAKTSASPRWLVGALFGMVAVASLTALKVAFRDAIGDPTPFLLYFGAALVAAWYGGFAAGLAATSMSAVLGYACFIAGRDPSPIVVATQLSVFALEGVAISWLTDRLAREHGRAMAAATHLESVMAAIDHGVTLQARDGRVVYANPAAARILGMSSPAEVVATAPARLASGFDVRDAKGEPVPPDQLPAAKVWLGEGRPELLVEFNPIGASTSHWSQIEAHPVRGDDGEVELVVNVFRDVTTSRRAALHREFLARAGQELASSLDYAATLATVARLAVPTIADWCAVDVVEDGEIRRVAVAHVDPARVRLVEDIQNRYPPDPNADSGVPEILRTGRPELIPVLPAELIEAVARDEEHLRLIRGLELHSYIGVPISRGGETFGVITLAMAESRRVYGEEDLELANALAERASSAIQNARLYKAAQEARHEAELANRSKDDFLAMLGHELRNPLAPIVAALELMKMRGVAGAEHERAVIDRQVRSLVRLVDDLLDVSRITRGRVELVKAPVDIADAIAKGLEVAMPLVQQRRHALEVDVPRGLVVEADAERLAQVVGNLVTNAAKYTEPGGRIVVRGAREGDEIVLSVRDTGLGIAPEVLPKIFDVFVQAPQALDRSEGGLGLGLPIVRSLVELHGGTVSAHSDGAGKGSAFVLRLPASTQQPIAAAPEVVPERASADGSLAVLVVDDNADLLDIMVRSLEILGHQPHGAVDGTAALELAGRVQPQLAFLDLGLPMIDGYELARRLRAVPGLDRIHLVAITGYGQSSDRARTTDAGFAAHVVKPIGIDTVSRLIDEFRATRPAP
jgi:signal transduction histidine kinase/PAS domain-containing protein/ActR/RegA family two-component response regulator